MHYFRFKNKFCLQKQDTTMGMAPSYTNLFMDIFEQTFLKSQTLQPLIWLRYIDGIFFHWQHGIDSLNKFLNDLNNPSPMKFTSKYSKTEINFFFYCIDIFLDSVFFKTKQHLKTTNSMKNLHFGSSHPMYVKKLYLKV